MSPPHPSLVGGLSNITAQRIRSKSRGTILSSKQMSSSFNAWFKGMENEAFPRSFGKNSFVVQYDCKWVSYSPARSRFCGQGRRGTKERVLSKQGCILVKRLQNIVRRL